MSPGIGTSAANEPLESVNTNPKLRGDENIHSATLLLGLNPEPVTARDIPSATCTAPREFIGARPPSDVTALTANERFSCLEVSTTVESLTTFIWAELDPC